MTNWSPLRGGRGGQGSRTTDTSLRALHCYRSAMPAADVIGKTTGRGTMPAARVVCPSTEAIISSRRQRAYARFFQPHSFRRTGSGSSPSGSESVGPRAGVTETDKRPFMVAPEREIFRISPQITARGELVQQLMGRCGGEFHVYEFFR